MFLSKTRTIPSKLPVFVLGRPFQFSLIFASKARAYPRKLPVFVPGRPFQLSIMFASSTRAYPRKLPVFVPGRPFQLSIMFSSKARATRVKYLSLFLVGLSNLGSCFGRPFQLVKYLRVRPGVYPSQYHPKGPSIG
jgi:hypothetical protein